MMAKKIAEKEVEKITARKYAQNRVENRVQFDVPELTSWKETIHFIIQHHDNPGLIPDALIIFCDEVKRNNTAQIDGREKAPLSDDELYHILALAMDHTNPTSFMNAFRVFNSRAFLLEYTSLQDILEKLYPTNDPYYTASAIIKLSDAAIFSVKSNFESLLDYSKLWFEEAFLRGKFDAIPVAHFTQELFDVLLNISRQISQSDADSVRFELSLVLDRAHQISVSRTKQTQISPLATLNMHASNTKRTSMHSSKPPITKEIVDDLLSTMDQPDEDSAGFKLSPVVDRAHQISISRTKQTQISPLATLNLHASNKRRASIPSLSKPPKTPVYSDMNQAVIASLGIFGHKDYRQKPIVSIQKLRSMSESDQPDRAAKPTFTRKSF